MDEKRSFYNDLVSLGFLDSAQVSFENFSQGMANPEVSQSVYGDLTQSGFLDQETVGFEAFNGFWNDSAKGGESVGTVEGSDSMQSLQQATDTPLIDLENIDLQKAITGDHDPRDLEALGLEAGDPIDHNTRLALQAQELSRMSAGKRLSSVDKETMIPDIRTGNYASGDTTEGNNAFYDPYNQHTYYLSEQETKKLKDDFSQSILGMPLSDVPEEKREEVAQVLTDYFHQEYIPESMIEEYAKANNLDFDKSKTAQFFSQFGLGASGVFGDALAMLDRLTMEGVVSITGMEGEDRDAASRAIDLAIEGGFSPVMGLHGGMQNPFKEFQSSITTNPEYSKNFWLSDLPQALGSSASFATVGLATGGTAGLASMATLGALGNAESQYEQAKQYGASDGDAWLSALLGAGVGATEAIPLSRMMNRLSGGGSNAVAKTLLNRLATVGREALQEGGEEAIQESLSHIANDLISQKIYNPEEIIFDEDLIKAASTGAISGMIMGGAIRAVHETGGMAKDAVRKQVEELQASISESLSSDPQMQSLFIEASTPSIENQKSIPTTIQNETETTQPETVSQREESKSIPQIEEQQEKVSPEPEVQTAEAPSIEGTDTGAVGREDDGTETMLPEIPPEQPASEEAELPQESEDAGSTDQSIRENPDVVDYPTTEEEAEAAGVETMKRARTTYFIEERDAGNDRILKAYRIKRGERIDYEGRVDEDGEFRIYQKQNGEETVLEPGSTSVAKALYSKKKKDYSVENQLIDDSRRELEEDFGVVEGEDGSLSFDQESLDSFRESSTLRENTISRLDEMLSRFDDTTSDQSVGFAGRLSSLIESLSNLDPEQQSVVEEIQGATHVEENVPVPDVGTEDRRNHETNRVDSDPSLVPQQISVKNRSELLRNVSPEQGREAKIALLSGNVSEETRTLANSPEIRRLASNGNTWAINIRQLIGKEKKAAKEQAIKDRAKSQNDFLSNLRKTDYWKPITDRIQGGLPLIREAQKELVRKVREYAVGATGSVSPQELDWIFNQVMQNHPGASTIFNQVVQDLMDSGLVSSELASQLGASSPEALARIIAQKQIFTQRGRERGNFLEGRFEENFASPLPDSLYNDLRRQIGDSGLDPTANMPSEAFGADPIAVNTRFTRRIIQKLFRRFPGIDVVEGLTREEYRQAYRDSLGISVATSVPSSTSMATRTPDSAVARYPLGFVWNSRIYFDPVSPPSPATQIHELAHIWIQIARERYPSLIRRANHLLEGTPFMEDAARDYGIYDEAGLLNIEQVQNEALVDAIVSESRNYIRELDGSLWRRIRKFVGDFWRKVLGFFGIRKRVKAELSEGTMTLTGLARQISQDILSDIPIGQVSSQDLHEAIQNNSGEHASRICIDDGMLAIELDRSWWGKKLGWFDRGVQSTRNLPKWIDRNRRLRLNRIETSRVHAKKLTERLHRAVNDAFTQEQRADVYRGINNVLVNREAFNAMISTPLPPTGTGIAPIGFISPGTINVDGVEYNLPQNIIEIVAEMRYAIDALSSQMISAGMISPGNEATFNANLGIYLHRSYRVHEDPDWLDRLESTDSGREVFNRARDFIVEQMTSRDIVRIEIDHREGSGGETTHNIRLYNASNNMIERRGVSDAWLASFFTSNPEIATSGTSSTENGGQRSVIRIDPDNPFPLPPMFEGQFNYLPEQAVSYLRSFLEEHSPNGERFFTPTTEGRMQKDILANRKDIPEQIRMVMGEHVDPRVNFLKTYVKQVALIESFRYQQLLSQEGRGVIFDQENPMQPSGPFTEQIASSESSSFTPLAGMYTTPELKQSLDIAFSPKYADSMLNRGMLMLNSWAKSMATVHNIAGQVRNFWSAGVMLANTGAFFSLFRENGRTEFMEALADAWGTTRELWSKTGTDYQQRWEQLARLGVINDNLSIEIIRDSVQRSKILFAAEQSSLLERMKASGPGQFIKRYNEIMEHMYQMPDDAVKVILFNLERNILQRAYPGRSDEQLDADAAEIVKATLPVYSRAPKFVKDLSRNVIFGTFVSFTTEMIRTMVINTPRMAVEEMRSDNPVIRNRGIARLAGNAMAYTSFLAAGWISKLFAGIDDEEEEAIRESLPPWAKHSALIFWGMDENGKHRVSDISHVDPMSVIVKPFVGALNITNTQQTATEKLAPFIEPFIGNEIGFSALIDVFWNDRNHMADIFSDKPTYQAKVYDPTAGKIMMIWDSSMYLADKLGPRSFATVGKLGKGAVSDLLPGDPDQYNGWQKELKEWAEKSRMEKRLPANRTSIGKESMELLSGNKNYIIEPVTSTYYRAQDFKTFLGFVRRGETIDKNPDRVHRITNHEFDKLSRKCRILVNKGFVSNSDMYGEKGVLRDMVNLPDKWVDALKRGVYDPELLK